MNLPASAREDDERPTTSSLRGRLRPASLLVGVLVLGSTASATLWFRRSDANDPRPKPPAAKRPSLGSEDIKYLQHTEHLGGFVLGDLAFPRIGKALRERDVEGLKAFFAEDFTGQWFDFEDGRVQAYEFATLRTWQAGRDSPWLVNRDQFVKALIQYRDELTEVKAVEVKVANMNPVEYGVLSGPWEGTGKLRLAGIDKAGARVERVVKIRCRIKEIGERTPESLGWFSGCDAISASHRQCAEPLLRDMTADTGIRVDRLHDNWQLADKSSIPFMTGGVYLADYDQDGWMDFLVTDLNGLFLYRGRGDGRFTDVTLAAELPREVPTMGAVFADFDNDGFEDLLIDAQIYRNENGKRFRRLVTGVSTTLELLAEIGGKFSVADYNRDGLLDLYVIGIPLKDPGSEATWLGSERQTKNQLWKNLGNWEFENVTEQAQAAGNSGRNAFAGVWFDANGDDFPDVLTACEFGANDYLLNQGDGTFRAGEMPVGYGGLSMGLTVGDVDNDGDGDPYFGNMYSKAGERIVGNLRADAYATDIYSQMRDFVSGNELYRNGGDGKFERIGRGVGIAEVGWAYGVCYADLDGDGLLDISAPVGFQSITRDKPDG